MNAYSENLRKKIVEALRRGRPDSEAARVFRVSGQVYVRPRTQLLAGVSLSWSTALDSSSNAVSRAVSWSENRSS